MKGLRAEAKVRFAGTGEQLLDRAIKDMGIWGGMDHSTSPDEDGYEAISFDVDHADVRDGLSGVLRWLESLGVEYSLTLHRWFD